MRAAGRWADGGAQEIYYNRAMHMPLKTSTVLGPGGLVADAMGLVKTLTMLALRRKGRVQRRERSLVRRGPALRGMC